jgi:hypothetical protein
MPAAPQRIERAAFAGDGRSIEVDERDLCVRFWQTEPAVHALRAREPAVEERQAFDRLAADHNRAGVQLDPAQAETFERSQRARRPRLLQQPRGRRIVDVSSCPVDALGVVILDDAGNPGARVRWRLPRKRPKRRGQPCGRSRGPNPHEVASRDAGVSNHRRQS